MKIQALMAQSNVGFGTSGARGRVEDMTDWVCYAYTTAFIQHLEQTDDLKKGTVIGIGGDLRDSTDRIMAACARAIEDAGYRALNCGYLPSPAIAFFGIENEIPTLMVTGSHIPDDRNGIKFNKVSGEILKQDEEGIRAQVVDCPADLFSNDGTSVTKFELTDPSPVALDAYVQRYLEFFAKDSLKGIRIGLYEHSSVASVPYYSVLTSLGADVTRLGHSKKFIPVDTEAIRPEDIVLGKQWANEYGFDCIISADGDGDRPLVSDENGNWLRGDVIGILCAHFLGAEVVATPVSCNTAVERSDYFREVLRTRIGSPYVIAAMEQAQRSSEGIVVGYEANGGFLTGTPIYGKEHILQPLPTRDAMIVPLALLMMCQANECPISQLLALLPERFTASDRIKEFPTEMSKARIAGLWDSSQPNEVTAIQTLFGALSGSIESVDDTDGLRIHFDGGDIIHLRPSGNAPELRCYAEADTQARAIELTSAGIEILSSWRE